VRKLIFAGAAAAVVVLGLGMWAGAAVASGGPSCPAATSCTYQPQWIIDKTTGNINHAEWMVTDGYGAPMAWVNPFGFYNLGDGTSHPGERICMTYNLAADIACMTSTGTLTLTPTGPGGPTGPTMTLTARDIAWLHKAELLRPNW
jgi:hypothetical protein